MNTPTELFQWWIEDEPTGEPRLTRYKLTRADAERAFPGAKPDLQTRELRDIQDPHAIRSSSRPGRVWA